MHDTAPLPLPCLVRAALDPAAYIVALLLVFTLSGSSISEMHVIVGALAFLLAAPGGSRRAIHIRAGFGCAAKRWLVVAGMLLVIGSLSGSLDVLDKEVMIGWLLLSPVVACAGHKTLDWLAGAIGDSAAFRRRAIIVGGHESGRDLLAQLKREPERGVEFLGFFDDRCPERLGLAGGQAVRGPVSSAAAFAAQSGVNVVYIALPIGYPRIAQLLGELKDTTASVYVVPDASMFNMLQPRLDTVHGRPMVAVCETPFVGIHAPIKRSEDLLLAGLLLLLLAPVMLAIALAVKLDSPGPALFKQHRYGQDGKHILVYKFRSMRVLEDGEAVPQARRGDPRVTRLGALLRRSSLDELPQLVNVLQGRMSLVGPRPHAVAHNEFYRRLISGYMIRHKVRPGITGWAQVNGLRGETDTLEKMRARVECDLAYLRNWSIGLDLQILARTAWIVLAGRNAY
jgi:putative colanic acid biosynthesis UDP-glucose lipid carrier transferase